MRWVHSDLHINRFTVNPNQGVTKRCRLSWLTNSLRICTVTRLDAIFRYPDRVPLTRFVQRAKNVFGMWAWNFCWVYCATGIFRRCNGKVFEHFDLQDRKQIFYHCATASLCTSIYDIHCVPSWDFPAVSVVTGSRIFRPYLVVTCRDFPAVSAVTGSRIFRPYL